MCLLLAWRSYIGKDVPHLVCTIIRELNRDGNLRNRGECFFGCFIVAFLIQDLKPSTHMRTHTTHTHTYAHSSWYN